MSNRWGWLLGIAIVGVSTFSTSCVFAEITPDSTLPNNSIVNHQGNINYIEAGTQAGGNLFHSFQQFSVGTGGTVIFNNAANIQNIISRVTGGSVSNIDGLISTLNAANLFLLNPNGIIFGPNASLNIGGSFIGSTANSLKFGDGTEFSATNPIATPLLTINVPEGLQFGSNPKEITVTGVGHDIIIPKNTRRLPIDTSRTGLQVTEGKTLALVGGKVSLEGGILKSPAGRIEIGSVGSNQTVSLASIPEGLKLGYEGIISFGDIQFSGKPFLGTTGAGGGTIALVGSNIHLTEQSILVADTEGNRDGGEISIVGDSINFNKSTIEANTYSSRNGGQIKLVANNIRLENNSDIGTTAYELGKAGDITLKAADSITIRNQNGIGSSTYGAGNTGQIEVKANSLLIEENSGLGTNSFSRGDAGEINIAVVGKFQVRNGGIGTQVTAGAGNTGKFSISANSFEVESSGINSGTELNSTANAAEININVADSFVLRNVGINANSLGTGNAGKIRITARNLHVEDAGVSSNTVNSGNSGEINFNVTDSFVLKNVGISAKSLGTGSAGNISITANNLQIEGANVSSKTTNIGNAGEINFNVTDSFTLKSAGISTNTSGTGNAGKINITAQNLQIESAGISSETTNIGHAGEINFNVTDSFVLKFAGINTNTFSTGDAGKINITAQNLQIESAGISSKTTNIGHAGEINFNVTDSFTLKSAGISTNTSGTGDAGKINITANSLQMENSGINSLTTNTGNAGQITITAHSVKISDRAELRVESTGNGNAGILNIVADKIKLDNQGQVNATSTRGRGGDIQLKIKNLLLLRRGSFISTTAGTTQQGGDGGNITINAPSGFILAVKSENSDITANAFTGTGGRVDIKARGMYGIQPRQSPTSLSDITASSQFGVNGKVTINTSIVEFSLGLVELPINLVDASGLMATSCAALANRGSSSFIITGRGGLHPSPFDYLSSDVVWSDTRLPTIAAQQHSLEKPIAKPPSNSNAMEIVPATGWVFNDKGEVTLIASAANATGLGSRSATCPKQ